MISTILFIAVILLVLGLLLKFDGTRDRSQSPYEKQYYKNFQDELNKEKDKNLYL